MSLTLMPESAKVLRQSDHALDEEHRDYRCEVDLGSNILVLDEGRIRIPPRHLCELSEVTPSCTGDEVSSAIQLEPQWVTSDVLSEDEI